MSEGSVPPWPIISIATKGSLMKQDRMMQYLAQRKCIPVVSGGQSNNLSRLAPHIELCEKRPPTTVCAQCPLVMTQIYPIQDLWNPIAARIRCNDCAFGGKFIKLRDYLPL